jgi:hypothetical protein
MHDIIESPRVCVSARLSPQPNRRARRWAKFRETRCDMGFELVKAPVLLCLPQVLVSDRQGYRFGLYGAHRGSGQRNASSNSPPHGVLSQYPAIIRLWENAWSEFVPFLDYGGWRRMSSGWGLGWPVLVAS